MNEILAGIYGTNHTLEKVAHASGQITTLSDLALALVTEELPEGAELEKVASVHDSLLEDLALFDLSGRAAAQSEFSAMEKQASEGDWSALNEFFSDEEPDANAQVRQAIIDELQRRAQH